MRRLTSTKQVVSLVDCCSLFGALIASACTSIHMLKGMKKIKPPTSTVVPATLTTTMHVLTMVIAFCASLNQITKHNDNDNNSTHWSWVVTIYACYAVAQACTSYVWYHRLKTTFGETCYGFKLWHAPAYSFLVFITELSMASFLFFYATKRRTNLQLTSLMRFFLGMSLSNFFLGVFDHSVLCFHDIGHVCICVSVCHSIIL